MTLPLPPYQQADTIDLLRLRKQRRIGAVELLQLAQQCCTQLNPQVNAIVYDCFPSALAAAAKIDQSPDPQPILAGFPLLVKDLSPVQHHPWACGSKLYQHRLASHSSPLLLHYRQLGLLVVGRSNCSEFGLSFSSNNALYGPCRNPVDPERECGGSSSGAAAAVGCGMLPFAHASDGGGSLRVPAACWQLPALKPSRRAYAQTGWNGLSGEHVITRSLRDSLLFLRLCQDYCATPSLAELEHYCRPPAPAPRCRVAYSAQPMLGRKEFSPAVLRAFEHTLSKLASLGHRLSPTTWPLDRDEVIRHIGYSLAPEIAAQIAPAYPQPQWEQMQPRSWLNYLVGHALSPQKQRQHQKELELCQLRMDQWLAPYDLFVSPLLSSPLPPAGQLDGPEFWQPFLPALKQRDTAELLAQDYLPQAIAHLTDFSPNTIPCNISGHAALVLMIQGCPIQLVAAQEELLFSIAAQLLEPGEALGEPLIATIPPEHSLTETTH